MSNQTINGKILGLMLMGGAASLASHASEINDLNVFPVADGDTGTNMSLTMEGGLSKIASADIESISAMSNLFAKGVLLAARGNSGVILSQIFAGINEGLSSYERIGAHEFAKAYKLGIEKSYAAVQNPTEGTILTVFRESTDYAIKNIGKNSTVEDFFKLHIEEAQRSLARTKELLPALAEADVIDSGGAGYLCIAQGMYDALVGKNISSNISFSENKDASAVDIDRFTRDSELVNGYCTEFLLRLTSKKTDPDKFDEKILISELEALGGESIVAYKADDIVKVHVHIFVPGAVLAAAQKYGEFLTVKIENMELGHSETEKVKKKSNKKFSVLAVATGEGLCKKFSELGADRIISGGQTQNPSIEEFIKAFDECDTENIIVLPNNKNIILAAKQAAEIYERAKIFVVETKNLMQGYSALSVITPGITDMKTLVEGAERAAKSVICCEITKAVRDVVIDGREIKKGDYIAITDGQLSAVSDTADHAAEEALAESDTDLSEIITVFAGQDACEEEREELVRALEEQYPDCEVTLCNGGQQVYDYLIAIE